MRSIIIGILAVGFVVFGTGECKTLAADPSTGSTAPSATGAAAPASAGGTMSPIDRVASTPKGQLKNPYTDYAGMADEGHKKFMSAGCNGCHGGGGGGGMCPPLTNDTWVYGPDDDTLFRLIAQGSDGLKAAGYHRVKQEVVVGPMPPFGGIIKTSDDLWRIITWIRSVNPSSATKPPLQ